MKIQEQQKGAVTVLRPAGPITGEDAAQFRSRLMNVRASSLGRLVVDVGAVPLLDSAALEALVEASRELGRSGQSLKLCGVNETLREVIRLTDLTSRFEYFEDVGGAVRSFL